MRRCAAILAAVMLPLGAASAADAQRPLSPDAERAWAAKDFERFDNLLLDETEACLKTAADSCLDLMLAIRQRLSGYNHFRIKQGSPSGWDLTRPSISEAPERLARAEAISAQAAARVLAIYGRDPDIVMGAEASVSADDAAALVTLYRATPSFLGESADPDAPALRAAIAARLYALGNPGPAIYGRQDKGPANDAADNNHAAAMLASGTIANSEAIALLRAVHARRQQASAAAPVPAAITALNLARLLYLTGDRDGSDTLHRANLPILAANRPGDARLAAAMTNHAETLIALDRPAEAELPLRDARAILIVQGGPAQSSVLRVDKLLAEVLSALGRHAEAIAILRAGLAEVDQLDAGAQAVQATVAAQIAADPRAPVRDLTMLKTNATLTANLVPQRRSDLNRRLATIFETQGDVLAARAATKTALRDNPRDPTATIMLARYELTRSWPDAEPDTMLNTYLFSAIEALPADHPLLVQGYALQGFLAARMGQGAAFLAVPYLRKSAAVIQRRLVARGFYDRGAERELKNFAPIFRLQTAVNWSAAQQLSPAPSK